jgi:malate dehydrogenase
MRSGKYLIIIGLVLLICPAAWGAPKIPNHAKVKASVPHRLSRTRARVAREIIRAYKKPLTGQVQHRVDKRRGYTKQIWTDAAGSQRFLLKRTDGSWQLTVKEGGRKAFYGVGRSGTVEMGEKGWSIREQAPGAPGRGIVPKKVTVGIVGPGEVGTSAAIQVVNRLKQDGVKDVKVVLVGRTYAKAKGRALDVSQAVSAAGLSGVSLRGTTGYGSLKKADVVVITAGAPRKPGMTRSDLVGVNAKVIRGISNKLKKSLPATTPVVLVTNPLDAMTHVAAGILEKKGNVPVDTAAGRRRRVFGMAGVLDGARLERAVHDAVSRKYRIPASGVGKVQATIIGPHGDQMVPLLSKLTIDGIPATRLLSQAEINKAVSSTRKMGGTITGLVGRSASVAPGAAVARMVSAMVTNSGEVMPASVFQKGEYGLRGLSIGVPVKLGTGGGSLVKFHLPQAEQDALVRSAAKVRQDIQSIP